MNMQRCSPETAAQALREARRVIRAGDDAGVACEWALATVPGSRAAQCMMLDWLLTSGHAREAATLSHALLKGSGDWRLWMRRAAALLALSRFEEADEAIEAALRIHGHHRRCLILKADIATGRRDHAAALCALERADALGPRDPALIQRMIAALLCMERPHDAQAILDESEAADPCLVAKVQLATGRTLDARETIEHALRWEVDSTQRIALRTLLIEVLERMGDSAALLHMTGDPDLEPCEASRLAEYLLASGDLQAARSVADHADMRGHLMAHVDAAATALAGESIDRTRSLSAQCCSLDLQPASIASPWLRSLLGLVIATQIDPLSARRAGADPAVNVLGPILCETIDTLDRAITRDRQSPRAATWQRFREQAHHALNFDDSRDVIESVVATPLAHAHRRAA